MRKINFIDDVNGRAECFTESRRNKVAEAIENGSNIDKALLPRAGSNGDQAGVVATNSIHLSYFFAWFIVFFLILLIGRMRIQGHMTRDQPLLA